MKTDKEKRKKWDKTYREKHADRVKISSKKFRDTHKEKERIRGRAKYIKSYKDNPEKMRKYWRKYAASPNGRYHSYKKQALSRGYSFDLTFDEFIKFWQKQCYYCGKAISGIGIDRVNNKQGYNKKNTVACCATCNHMKKDKTVKSFLNHCKRIVDYKDF